MKTLKYSKKAKIKDNNYSYLVLATTTASLFEFWRSEKKKLWLKLASYVHNYIL